MLAKNLARARALITTAHRPITTSPHGTYVIPSSLRDVVEFLDKQRPTFTCVYFHADWNPICEKIDREYEEFCAKNSSFTHVKVDCDATPQVKFYFDARVEPQFLFLLNGAEAKR
jgi:thioredoxin-like negative regulator of GroEL